MNITGLNKDIDFKSFIMKSMTALEYNTLHESLGISKKMLTVILKEPKKIKACQLYLLLSITKKDLLEFAPFIQTNH